MPHTALLVIDLQRGAFDGVRCPPIDAPERLMIGAGKLVEAAREAGRPIVFIQHSEQEAGAFEEGTDHWLLHEKLVPAEGDTVVRKSESSSFDNTGLDATLKSLGVDDLVLCGLQSEHCVSNTARSALGLGYRVHVAEDAHGTWPSEGRTSTEIRAEVNERLEADGADVAPVAKLVQWINTGVGR